MVSRVAWTGSNRTIEIQAGEHAITAADPLPTDLSEALDAINGTHRLVH